MNTPNRKQTNDLTRGKLALIISLVIAIAGVLFFQLRGPASLRSLTDSSVNRPENARRPSRQPTGPATAEPQPESATSAWPLMGLKQASEFDPFAVPALVAARTTEQRIGPRLGNDPATSVADAAAGPDDQPQVDPADELRRQRIQAFLEQGVSAVIAQGNDRIALIGNRELRVGDVLDGFRVAAIRTDGVELEFLAQAPTTNTNTPHDSGLRLPEAASGVDGQQ
jgi:hypothetical protein